MAGDPTHPHQLARDHHSARSGCAASSSKDDHPLIWILLLDLPSAWYTMTACRMPLLPVDPVAHLDVDRALAVVDE
jgi:hypothetical protein